MAQFDMRGQQVSGKQQIAGRDLYIAEHDQYVAGHDMNFGAIHNAEDLATALAQLQVEVARAKQDGVLPKKLATDVEYQVTKATQEAEEEQPDKKTIVDHLATAKAYIEGIAAAGGLVTTIVSAIQAVQKLL